MLPEIPTGAEVLGPSAVEKQMEREIAEMKEELAKQRMSPEEFDNKLRRMATLLTTHEDPVAVMAIVRNITEGSPAFPKTEKTFSIPADNRVPTIFPNGYDDSMSKDMSRDVGGWDP